MDKELCLGCEDTSKEVILRGLCEQCYGAAYSQIIAHQATWDEIEELGLCLPPKTGNRAGKFLKKLKLLRELKPCTTNQ